MCVCMELCIVCVLLHQVQPTSLSVEGAATVYVFVYGWQGEFVGNASVQEKFAKASITLLRVHACMKCFVHMTDKKSQPSTIGRHQIKIQVRIRFLLACLTNHILRPLRPQ